MISNYFTINQPEECPRELMLHSSLPHPVFKNLPCKPLGSELLRRQSPGDAGRPRQGEEMGLQQDHAEGKESIR